MNTLAIKSLELINFSQHIAENGSLTVLEGLKNVPFEIARVFFVLADSNSIRGNHSHIECSQLLVCLSGSIDVKCDDGKNKKVFSLSNPNVGLVIPPGIWASQYYREDNSVLAVLCDKKYVASDYIRNYEVFLKTKLNKID
ncbi:FdtA/QdtA family cupin domain-containing protein [Polynucleobacter sp. AP-Sanab-80-C2]|uniref:sugar 3,4-ketoisomerase n=1 Tax=Polynucleobacter sp. AP-Sanab-80-C2 TaxID=3108274 RepID=UPI002B22BE1E|nr:FdtA/QdtA family cupin domain-containing protein [Polynucleobacter sp. AP-Sanab-80-C2]MEA9598553.1 FdtA/QdtA family cupin domain-containing protein [Polynucleobacter sp. AP-Sanab-80-C2]